MGWLSLGRQNGIGSYGWLVGEGAGGGDRTERGREEGNEGVNTGGTAKIKGYMRCHVET